MDLLPSKQESRLVDINLSARAQSQQDARDEKSGGDKTARLHANFHEF